jgi:serine/threonine protein kinase
MGRNLIDQRYELRTLVGSGGMADVYLAVDEVLGREVALKLLKDRYAENEEFVERFRREAKSAAALSSPYIVPIFDRGETDDGTYYITMEYLPGGTLKERITATGALRPQAAAQVALQVAKALQTAHVRGVVHRDIKPRNILLADSDHVKVADFGIARAADATTISQTGDLLGGVEEVTSQTVHVGVIMKQDPPPGTPLAPGSYVYLTDSVGPPAEDTNATQSVSSTASAQSVPSGGVSGEAAAVRGHYEAIGAGNFEEAYSYFGPTMRSETDEANWIAGEESSQIQSITIDSLEVNEVSGSTATATVDFSSINKAETARFHILWMLVKEGGEWKLDHQLSGQRIG